MKSNLTSKPSYSLMTKTLEEMNTTFKNQITEWLMFPYQRIICISTFFIFTSAPLVLGHLYLKELHDFYHQSPFMAFMISNNLSAMLFVIFQGLFLVIYTLNHPFFEQYKANEELWPWQVNPEQHKKDMKRMLIQSCFNIWILGNVLTVMLYKLLGFVQNIDFYHLPTITEFYTHWVFNYLIGELVFYWGHRLLHHPKLYQHIHKIHHESKNSVAMAAMHVHPLEFILVDILTIYGGSIIMGPYQHEVVRLSFIMWQIVSNMDDHCGYDFPWFFTKAVPWSASNVFHNYHHLLNIGNYSAHTLIWDSIFGTNLEYIAHMTDQESRNSKLNYDKKSITKIKAH